MHLRSAVCISGLRVSFGQVAEWFCVTIVVTLVAFFAISLGAGWHLDYDVRYNPALVWWGVAGTVLLSFWYGWFVLIRDLHMGRLRKIHGFAAVGWLLTSGAILWLVAALVDMSRLIPSNDLEHGELLKRVAVEWGAWIPFLLVLPLPFLLARRFGVNKIALASLPLQAFLWWAALNTPT
ncbi:MAG: hypothetical protein KTU85_01010 [Acidimicrobiia bacterium]|nr:hypothetical protein [Acidimicrobiia bacterium]MCY4457754.1 hypothetical protein [Acidimicrobiaceae bacterium]